MIVYKLQTKNLSVLYFNLRFFCESDSEVY
jgi:hypothetical protein